MVVEYTFKNSPGEKAFTLTLKPEGLGIQSPGSDRDVWYDEIRSVNLRVAGDGLCQLSISAAGQTLRAGNRYYLSDGSFEDRSPQYVRFVRKLHDRLGEHTTCTYGTPYRGIFVRTILGAFVFFLMAFVLEYADVRGIDPFLQAIALTVLFGTSLWLMPASTFSEKYPPDHIPLRFLP